MPWRTPLHCGSQRCLEAVSDRDHHFQYLPLRSSSTSAYLELLKWKEVDEIPRLRDGLPFWHQLGWELRDISSTLKIGNL
eukprot:Skav223387  [mRNA]  locus=scaffold2634:360894:362392:+ [translate_table: standard]